MPRRGRTRNPIRYAMIGVFLLIMIVLAVLMKNVYDYFEHQYNLMQHPISYKEHVEKYAEENGLDKYFVYAVIKTESGFNPGSESSVGARGLMQIMEDTFDWIKMLKNDDTTYDDMYDVETNIEYGSYLFGYLMRYYGDEQCAIAAYHAGIGSVDAWLENPEYSSDGQTIKKFPKADTEHYVSKIETAYSNYLKLYTEDN